MNKLLKITQLCLLTLTGFLGLSVIAQNTQLEVNYNKVRRSENDTIKANGLNFLAKYHINKDQDSAWFYVENALLLSQKLGYRAGTAYANLTIGILENDRGNFPRGLDHILKATEEAQQIKDYTLLAGCKLNLGNFYIKTGDIDKALEVYQEGIDLCQKHHIVYTQASLYTSYGMGLKQKGELDSALIYYEKVLDIHHNVLHDSVVIAAIYNNVAALYFQKNDNQTAENYLLKSYEINRRTGNMRYQLMNLSNLAELNGMPGGDFDKSVNYFEQAIEMAKKMEAKEALESIYNGMSRFYYNHGKFHEAYDNLMISLAYKDSIMGDDKQNDIRAISEQFKTKQIQDSLRIKNQELLLAQSNAEAANLRASKTSLQLFGAIAILILILGVLIIVFRNAKNQKRINNLLHEKNNEINLQKLTIEEKNLELTDSITYAKRIQSALLPSPGYLQRVLGDHFLIFKPKDIVSGDFYWVKQEAGKHYFAVADCTGHGVPGAMVSVLGFETIERVASSNPQDAALFIKEVNESLVHALTEKATETSNVRDGMDIALCIVSDRKKLSYCGANNECYVIRKSDQPMPAETSNIRLQSAGNYTLIELRPTKRPVGAFESSHDFTGVDLHLLQGDTFYLFSDGFADQFGGDKGKKMKTSTLRNALLSCVHLPMPQQKEFLEKYLKEWQGGFDQLDDITVLGARVE